jgi:DASH complex subunit DAD2
MSRQSVAANRPSHAVGLNPVNSAAAAAKFLEKKKEFDAVSALQRASTLYLQRIEGLADDCETMADAGKSNGTRITLHVLLRNPSVHGEVLEQWPRMFQILNLFRTFFEFSMRKLMPLILVASGEETQGDSGPATTQPGPGQRLVRIPIEELHDASEEQRQKPSGS